MTDEQVLCTRTAESIALLESLGKVPVAPSHNACVASPGNAQYSLGLRAERHLTSTLAFLSSIKDDQLKIAAVCVREEDDKLQVLVAVNAKSSSQSQHLHVDLVKRGLQDILGLLHNATSTSRVCLKGRVLGAIVSMCRSRIMSRARLRPNEDKTRFPVHIDDVVTRVRGLSGLANKTPFMKSMRALALHLNNYLEETRLRGNDPAHFDSRLIDIIHECCVLSSISNWKNILLVSLNTGSHQMGSTGRQAVVNMVEKLAQYSVSSKTLVDAARRNPIVRKASVVAVRLGEDAFHSIMNDEHPPAATAREVFSRVKSSQVSNLNFDVLRSRLFPSERKANKKYRESLENAVRNSRIHAEMQLIWYLNSHPSSKQPRVIASHKDACYLCNAFVTLHGIYCVPRSHGRLYPGWKLPTAGMADVRKGFVQELERLIVSRVAVVLSGAPRLMDPRESRVNSTVTSLTTILTVDEATVVDEVGGSTSDAETIKPTDKSSESSSASSSDIVVAEDTASNPALGVSRVDFAGGAIPTAAPPSPANDQQHLDNDGSWQTVEQGRRATLRLTPKLRVHVEYSSAAQQPAPQRLRFKAHELSTTEMAEMDAGGAETVYDVHRDLPLLQDVLCRANCRSVCLQMRSTGQQRTRRFRVELG